MIDELKLDVVTIISDSTPREWVDECLRSIDVAASQAGYEINMIRVPGIPGHIGNAMRAGIDRSTADWLAWVDDDDYVLPNAFACLHSHFAARPTAICAREIKLGANGHRVPSQRRHHLTAFRADVARVLPMDRPDSSMLECVARAAELGAVVDELSWIYMHRIWRSAGQHVLADARRSRGSSS
jgi:hypothetical protein